MGPSRHLSARLRRETLERLERYAARAGMNKSRLAERYIEEGMRMEDHPGVVFRDGPAGRRAALAGGPDVWEVIAAVGGSGLTGEEAIAAGAEWSGLPTAPVRAAVGYYAEFPEEIDERIRSSLEEADAAEERWRREQNAVS